MSTARDILLGTAARRRLTLLGVAMLFTLVSLELACQAYAVVVQRGFARIMQRPEFYYQRSEHGRLGYGLQRGYERVLDDRRVRVNTMGFREDSESRFEEHTRIAVLGDSVVFGTALSQDQTISAALQRRLDADGQTIKVLNLGVPGYGLGELPDRLREAMEAYRPHAVVYVLNLNDFALRDTRFEGADNGLYRMYHRPLIKTPWFIRKALYRLKKGDVLPSPEWYEWLYEGTRERTLPRIAELQRICREHDAGFAIALAPVGAGPGRDDPRIVSLVADLSERVRAGFGLELLDPTAQFAAAAAGMAEGVAGLIDPTDHYTAPGCEVMGAALEPLVRGLINDSPGPTRPTGTSP